MFSYPWYLYFIKLLVLLQTMKLFQGYYPHLAHEGSHLASVVCAPEISTNRASSDTSLPLNPRVLLYFCSASVPFLQIDAGFLINHLNAYTVGGAGSKSNQGSHLLPLEKMALQGAISFKAILLCLWELLQPNFKRAALHGTRSGWLVVILRTLSDWWKIAHTG